MSYTENVISETIQTTHTKYSQPIICLFGNYLSITATI